MYLVETLSDPYLGDGIAQSGAAATKQVLWAQKRTVTPSWHVKMRLIRLTWATWLDVLGPA
jgi:hypothetical protein